MIAIVWEFIVKEEAVPEFQRTYGPDGDWAVLFRQYPGYAGTTLLQDAESRTRFLTIDRWESEALFNRMLDESRQEYSRLDSAFSELTVSERKLGVFRVQ
jgi:heme-degrading monooxygenase HmoA